MYLHISVAKHELHVQKRGKGEETAAVMKKRKEHK